MPLKQIQKIEHATQEQKLAVAMELTQKLLESQQYPKDLVIDYLSSYLWSWFLQCGLKILMPHEFSVFDHISGTDNVKEYEQWFEKNYYSSTLEKFNIKETNPFECFNKLLAQYELRGNNNAFVRARLKKSLSYTSFISSYPKGCNSDTIATGSLNHCLSNFPHDDIHSSGIFTALISDSEIKSTLVEMGELLTKKSSFFSEQIKILNKKICLRLATIGFTGNFLTKLNMLSIPISILKGILYEIQSSIGLRKFWTASSLLTVAISNEKVFLKSSMELSNYIEDIDELIEGLKQLEKKSIPWKLYIDRAFLMVLPFITFLTLFSSVGSNLSTTLLTIITPIFFRLVLATIRKLHYIMMVYPRLTLCVSNSESWLNEALAKLNESVVIKEIRLIDDVEKIQFEIKPRINLNDNLINKKIIAMIKLFYQYKINCIEVIGNKKNKFDAIYINAIDVYKAFSTNFGRKSNLVERFNTELTQAIQKLVYEKKIETNMLNRLKKSCFIVNYWHQESKNNIIYEVRINNEKIREFLVNRGYTVLNDSFTLMLEPLEQNYQQILHIFSDFEKTVGAHQPQSYLASNSSNVKKRIQTKIQPLQTQVQLNPTPIAPQNDAFQTIEWTFEGVHYASNDENVYMIYGTERYTNPIYVTHTLMEEQFSSNYTFERVIEQIKNPRFARAQGQPGLFIVQGQTQLELKVLGTHGQGDVRCYAQNFVVASNKKNGPHLYIVNQVENHAH